MVLTRAMSVFAVGIATGLALAIVIGRWVGSMLYNLARSDAPTLSASRVAS
jgi:hypothetical protein